MPAYDAITPAQWVIFLWVALIAFSCMWWWFWRSGQCDTPVQRDEAGLIEIVVRAWSALLHWRPAHMSSSDDFDDTFEGDTTSLANAPEDALQPVATPCKPIND